METFANRLKGTGQWTSISWPSPTLQLQFRLYIPFLGIARPQPQFPHSCVSERVIHIFPGSVHIFPPAEKADPSWEYIIRSQTHECGNRDWGPDIPFLGIFVSNFRHFVFAVYYRRGCAAQYHDWKSTVGLERWQEPIVLSHYISVTLVTLSL
jgi:hypothetical protein